MTTAPKRDISFQDFILAKKEKQSRSRSASWVLFLSLYPEIEEYLKAGHNAHEIWEYLHEVGAFKFSYRSFLRLLARRKAEASNEKPVADSHTEETDKNSAAEKSPEEDDEPSGIDENWEPLKSNRKETPAFRVRTKPMSIDEIFPKKKA